MPSARRPGLLLLCFLFVGGSAPAVRLVDLFDAACLAAGGDAAGARQVLTARGLHPMRGKAAARLLARPGQVYDASVAGHHMAVLSFDDGTCGTVADDLDAGAALSALSARMKARGVAISALGAAPAGAAQLYRLQGPSLRMTLMVSLHPDGDLTRVSMLAKPDGG